MRYFTSRFDSNGKAPRDGTRRYFYDIWPPFTLLVITVSFTSTFFTVYQLYASSKYHVDLFFCNADGKLESTDSSYQPFWDPNLYFTINIAFGELPYSGAKVIDAAWDAVVGRGGQFVAAVVAYRTLRRSFTLTMETCTYRYFVVLSPNPARICRKAHTYHALALGLRPLAIATGDSCGKSALMHTALRVRICVAIHYFGVCHDWLYCSALRFHGLR
jgi:hypothetical protein